MLADLARLTTPFPLDMPALRFLGRGFAIEVRSQALFDLRAHLARQFRPWLTPQDSQGFRPHVTIQNKVLPQVARALMDALSPDWQAEQAMAEGLLLWEYLGGPWRQVAEFPFATQLPPTR